LLDRLGPVSLGERQTRTQQRRIAHQLVGRKLPVPLVQRLVSLLEEAAADVVLDGPGEGATAGQFDLFRVVVYGHVGGALVGAKRGLVVALCLVEIADANLGEAHLVGGRLRILRQSLRILLLGTLEVTKEVVIDVALFVCQASLGLEVFGSFFSGREDGDGLLGAGAGASSSGL